MLKYMIVNVRDTITEARMDAIEAAARGKIGWRSDDGRGNLTLWLVPKLMGTKGQRKRELDAVLALGVKARWED